MKINQEEFETLLNSVTSCYDKDCADKLPKMADFISYFIENNGEIDLLLLLSLEHALSNKYFLSVVKRCIAVVTIQVARESSFSLDILSTWKLILDSILLLPSSNVISSIGSQGFLSIPLYRNDKIREEFEFIRLHIWDDSLSAFINREACERFSIHSHTFHTHSWIILGEILNDRYSVKENNENNENSLFYIEYNSTINEVNQHTSCARNSGKHVDVNQIGHEVYTAGNTYQIAAGDYHRSASLTANGLSATLFSFTAKHGLVSNSYVVGPKNINSSEINRKMHIDPKNLLIKLDSELIIS